MLIPSIDLKGGKVVQLVQGRKLAIESDDLTGWIERFRGSSKVQVIDLDAALDSGINDALVRRICAELPCRVGGGVRTMEHARELLDAGAHQVILGSSLFKDGRPDLAFAERIAETLGRHRLIAAVDSEKGRVVIRGWREATPMTAAEAARALEPFVSEFLYTHVDTEGLMGGIDLEAVLEVRRATTRRLTAAGGIRSQAEIDELDSYGIDAVVGMAIYTGILKI
jgi:phosphoribosylformimino-5-aminoimidazole carboxamide ribotide isomerase